MIYTYVNFTITFYIIMKGDLRMKKKIMILPNRKFCLGINLKITYFTDSIGRIELRRMCYLPKSDEFQYNYMIPKTYIELFQFKQLTKDLENQLKLYEILPYNVIAEKINKYNELKQSKNILKRELLFKEL